MGKGRGLGGGDGDYTRGGMGVEVEVEVGARLAATKGRGGRVASRKKGCVGCVVDVQNEK